MPDTQKRKQAPNGEHDGGGSKRSKGGSGKKWQTPHAAAKSATYVPRGGSVDPGDVGIWATCMKNKEGKATIELKSLFDEYAEKLYGLKHASAVSGDNKEEDEEEGGDIESSIAAELSSLAPKPVDPETRRAPRQFQAVHLDIACVLFFKTQAPIDPIEFVQRICQDAADGGPRRSRFVNRLTPMTLIGKASENGLKETAKKVLGEHFELAEEGKDVTEQEAGTGYSYAIRPTIRNHNTLKRDVVIPAVANLISSKHKVNLSKPDKVIIIEIYQTICGMAVVDGHAWEGDLKRFNLFEIHQAVDAKAEAEKEEATEVTGTAEVTESAEAGKPAPVQEGKP